MYLLFTMKLCWLCRLEYVFKRLDTDLMILGSFPNVETKILFLAQAQIEFKPNSIWGKYGFKLSWSKACLLKLSLLKVLVWSKSRPTLEILMM